MRRTIAPATFICWAMSLATAMAAQTDVTGTAVIANNGNGGQRLVDGDNPLDQATPFSCASSVGCLVTIQVMAGTTQSNSTVRLCSVIDGQDASPKCLTQWKETPIPQMVSNSLQTMDVVTGDHTAQTLVRVHVPRRGVPPKLRAWQVIYTIYGK